MPASLYQSNFNMERIANFELPDSNSAATVKLALELASVGSNFGFDSSDLHLGLGDHLSLGSGPTLAQLDEKARKSQNMTECVPVPTSEHVAEIVGRQGEFFISLPLLYRFWVAYWAGGAPAGGIERESSVASTGWWADPRRGIINKQIDRWPGNSAPVSATRCRIDYFLAAG